MKTELQSAEILRALDLLLLFDAKHQRMSFQQIMEIGGHSNIPPVLQNLKLLEKRNFLEKMVFSGKTLWEITSLGRQARNQIEEIIGTEL